MPWTSQQDALNQEARLFLASPEVVFDELKKLSAKAEFGKNDRLENVLIKRNHPLINLGLACYGANKEVFASLYKYSLAPAKDEKDAQYKKGLRIGCLSNSTLAAARVICEFPSKTYRPSRSLAGSLPSGRPRSSRAYPKPIDCRFARSSLPTCRYVCADAGRELALACLPFD